MWQCDNVRVMRIEIQNNPLAKHSIEFALMIIKYSQQLEDNKKFVIARQLLKSGTSIGACVMEAQSAESKADFIHKLKIADKEAQETWYWLYLCKESENYLFDDELTKKLDEIMRLLNSIISSSRK